MFSHTPIITNQCGDISRVVKFEAIFPLRKHIGEDHNKWCGADALWLPAEAPFAVSTLALPDHRMSRMT